MAIRFSAAFGGLAGLLTCLSAFAMPAHAATPCMVLGDASAKVTSVEGVRSPVFETADCAKLRLVSGHALASWVDTQGKPKLLPITASGVAQVPRPGSEERSVRVAWSELTSTRADQKPAYMRGMGTPHPVAVYVPRDGLAVPGTATKDASVRVEPLAAGGGKPTVLSSSAGKAVRLGRDLLHPGVAYRVEVDAAGHKALLEWRVVTSARQSEIDSGLERISSRIQDPLQRDIVTAMLYDQLKLGTNLSLLAPHLRATRVAGAGR